MAPDTAVAKRRETREVPTSAPVHTTGEKNVATVAPENAPRPALAMREPTYLRPAEAQARSRMQVAIRGRLEASVELEALAPEHVALTRSASPVLFWRLSALPRAGTTFLLQVMREDSSEDVYEGEIPSPRGAGLQELRLADLGVHLETGIPYTWFVVLRSDPKTPARDLLAQGWVLRREPPPMDPVDAAELPAALAASGYWYDALQSVLELRRQQPENESIRSGLAALLTQAGLRGGDL